MLHPRPLLAALAGRCFGRCGGISHSSGTGVIGVAVAVPLAVADVAGGGNTVA